MGGRDGMSWPLCLVHSTLGSTRLHLQQDHVGLKIPPAHTVRFLDAHRPRCLAGAVVWFPTMVVSFVELRVGRTDTQEVCFFVCSFKYLIFFNCGKIYIMFTVLTI